MQFLTLFGLAMISVIWLGIRHNLNTRHESSEKAAVQNISNLSRIFEEHVTRAIQEADKTLLLLKAAFDASPETFDFRAWLTNPQFSSELAVQYALIGADGIMLASNVGPAKNRVDLGDREHFRLHVDKHASELFISKPGAGPRFRQVVDPTEPRSLRQGRHLQRRAGFVDGSLSCLALLRERRSRTRRRHYAGRVRRRHPRTRRHVCRHDRQIHEPVGYLQDLQQGAIWHRQRIGRGGWNTAVARLSRGEGLSADRHRGDVGERDFRRIQSRTQSICRPRFVSYRFDSGICRRRHREQEAVGQDFAGVGHRTRQRAAGELGQILLPRRHEP